MCFAVVAKSKREVKQYFEEVGTDVEGEDILAAAEVFPVGDGRYLIVEAALALAGASFVGVMPLASLRRRICAAIRIGRSNLEDSRCLWSFS